MQERVIQRVAVTRQLMSVMLNGSSDQHPEHAILVKERSTWIKHNANEASRAAWNARLFIGDSLN